MKSPAPPASDAKSADPTLTAPRSPWQAGLAAARANLLPGLLLQAVGLAVLLAYYFHGPTRLALERLQAFRVEWGLIFSACSTALFAGAVPLLLRMLLRNAGRVGGIRPLLFLLGFWAVKGMEVDLFYRLQAWMIGDSVDWGTILVKVLIDQGLYVPFWAVPSTVLAYAWKDAGFNVHRTRRLLGTDWLRQKLVPILVSNWGVWIPAVAIIYCLPLPLQLPMQNLVLCLWVLLLMFLTGEPMSPAEKPARGDQPRTESAGPPMSARQAENPA